MTSVNKVISGVLACVASLLVGCGGGSGGGAAKPANVDPDGFYGFDGIGWAIGDNQLSQDGWDRVGSQDGIYVELTANSPSAMAMAQASYDDINSQLGGSTQ